MSKEIGISGNAQLPPLKCLFAFNIKLRAGTREGGGWGALGPTLGRQGRGRRPPFPTRPYFLPKSPGTSSALRSPLLPPGPASGAEGGRGRPPVRAPPGPWLPTAAPPASWRLPAAVHVTTDPSPARRLAEGS